MKKLLLAVSLLASLSVSAEWRHVERIDLMTDLDASYIGSAVDGATLIIRCSGGDFDIIVNTGYVGSKIDYIMSRFDKEQSIYTPISPAAGGSAVFISADKKQELIDGFKKHNKVVFLALDFRGRKQYGIFDLTGFTEQAKKLSCLK